ncbi:MAG: DUF120 domain-containing protein [Candidatus Aenigmatarchaeota archaeon]
MLIKGKIVPGMAKGHEITNKYFFRIKNILKFEPFKGTMNIKLEQPFDPRHFAEKRIEHVLLNGRTHVEAYMVPVKISKVSSADSCDCWILKLAVDVHNTRDIELISDVSIKEKLGLNDGDELEINILNEGRRAPRQRGKETRINR